MGTRTNNERWRYFSASPISGQPIVGNLGELYFGTASGRVNSVGSDGRMLWKYTLAAPVTSTAAITNSRDVIFGVDNGHVVSLSATGQPRWDFAVGGTNVTAPVINNDGSIFVGTSAGSVVSLSKIGAFQWSTSLGSSPVLGTVLTSVNDLYATTQSGLLVKLATASGSPTWSSPFDLHAAAVSGPIAMAGGKLCVGTAAGNVVVVTPSGGSSWSADVGASISNRPAVGPTGMVLVPTTAGEVVAISPDTHTVAWRTAVGSGAVSAPIVGIDGVIYAGAHDGTVRALQWPDGATFWQAAAGGSVASLSMGADGTIYAATSDGQVVAIGTTPTIGHFVNVGPRPECVAPSGLPWDPAIAALIGCTSDTPWAPIAVMTGGAFSDPGGNRKCGQENCSIVPPSGTTSCGLSGLCYTFDDPDAGTGSLSFPPPPSGTPANCEIRWCQVQTDGTEAEITLTQDQLTRNPRDLVPPTVCSKTDPQKYCPVDPDKKTDRECTRDSDCHVADGEACGVFCDDTTCANPTYRCALRKSECTDLAEEPSGPYAEKDPSTWPCEEFRECAEAGPLAGEGAVTGDPQIKDTAAVDQVCAPPPGTTGMNPERVATTYPSYLTTLDQTKCDAEAYKNNSIEQFDPRSGGSGNTTWGVYASPDIQHHADVTASVFGDPTFDVNALGSFQAGAYVWGHNIEAFNFKAAIDVSPCQAVLTKSMKVFGEDYFSYADGGDVPQVDKTTQEDPCNAAATTLSNKLGELKKALYDARLAWDIFSDPTGAQKQAMCNRTNEVFGTVESGTCTTASVQRWIDSYQTQANDFMTYMNGQYVADRGLAQNSLTGQVSLTPDSVKLFDGLGAAVSYPVGPLWVTMEIEVTGDVYADGSIDYSALPVGSDGSGPNANVSFTPGGAVNAFVFVGVGVPGISVGVQGQLKLLEVDVPLHAGVKLQRVAYADPRDFASSGLFGVPTSGAQPGLLGGGSLHRWTANWNYGAGLKLETMSGQVDLAARIRLLFFKKTFRKKIASWKGFTQTYAFVGTIGSPLDGTKSFDLNYDDIPYPEGFNLAKAFQVTPQPASLPASAADLGPKSMNIPGVCNSLAPTCTVHQLNDPCVTDFDCCGTGACIDGHCKQPAVIVY